MKDTISELNMTVVTIVAIAALAGVFYLWIWPSIQISIAKNTCKTACGEPNNCDANITKSVLGDGFDATSCCGSTCTVVGSTGTTTE